MVQNTERSDIDTVLTCYSGTSSENKPVKISVGLHNEIWTLYLMNIKQEGEKCCMYQRCQLLRLYSVDGKNIGNPFPSDTASYRRRMEYANVSKFVFIYGHTKKIFLIVSLND
jgi:hypothetical protein